MQQFARSSGVMIAAALALVAAAVTLTAQTITPERDPAAMTSTAIVEEATARAAEIEAQSAGDLSSIEQTATALVEDLFTPLPFDPVPGGPPLPGADRNTGDSGPDFTPLLVIGAALVVLIFAGGLARLNRSEDANGDATDDA